VAELQAAIKGARWFAPTGARPTSLYPDGIGDSKLTIAVIERKLGARGTARNWNTVLKLGALSQPG
jgi:uncharacterized protein (DUF1697 family)